MWWVGEGEHLRAPMYESLYSLQPHVGPLVRMWVMPQPVSLPGVLGGGMKAPDQWQGEGIGSRRALFGESEAR